MFKKHILKFSTVFILVFLTVALSSFSAFAYVPVFSFPDSNWNVDSNLIVSQTYPNKVNSLPVGKEAYEVSEVDGRTYYMSRYVEDTEKEIAVDAVPPDLGIQWNDNSFGFLYRINDMFFFFYCDSKNIDLFVEPYLEDNNESGMVDYYNFYYKVSENCNIRLYYSTYPYSSWVKTFDKSSSPSTSYECRKWHDNIVNSEYEYYWASKTIDYAYTDSTGNFNAFVGSHLIVSDGTSYSDAMAATYQMTPAFFVSVFVGHLSRTFSGEDINYLKTGECCIMINDIGVIVGMDSNYCFAAYNMYIYNSFGVEIAQIPLYGRDVFSDSNENVIESVLHEYDLHVGDYSFRDIINFSCFDYDIGNINNNGSYKVVFEYMFLSDGYNLFFPGNLEIVDFDSYDAQSKHDEVVGSINSAAGLVNGTLNTVNDSIGTLKSDLTTEIVNAATNVSSSINTSKTEIVTSVSNASTAICGQLTTVNSTLGTVGSNITNKLEETKTGLLEGIKSFFIPNEAQMINIKGQWDELLKNRFGALYQVGGIISDFGGSLSSDQIKARGVKNTITMPQVTVNLVGTPFTFGGYEVQIIPDGFDVLVTALKAITSIVCTFAFVNALRRKYDKIIGGNEV